MTDQPQPAPPLDEGVLASLRGLADPDGPDLLAELVELFMTDAPPRLAGIAQAVASSDAEALRRCAHALKGASGTLGARRLADVCGALEAAGRAGTTEGVDLAALHSEYESVRDALWAVAHG